jgi:hypothetical protein
LTDKQPAGGAGQEERDEGKSMIKIHCRYEVRKMKFIKVKKNGVEGDIKGMGGILSTCTRGTCRNATTKPFVQLTHTNKTEFINLNRNGSLIV